MPKLNNGQSGQQYGIIEPYSELEDYLDKDDFSNLLNVLGQVSGGIGSFAGKTSSGLLSLGESLFNNFVFRKKGQDPNAKELQLEAVEENDNTPEDDYIVPGQKGSFSHT